MCVGSGRGVVFVSDFLFILRDRTRLKRPDYRCMYRHVLYRTALYSTLVKLDRLSRSLTLALSVRSRRARGETGPWASSSTQTTGLCLVLAVILGRVCPVPCVLHSFSVHRSGVLSDLPSHALPRVCTCLSRTVLRVAVSSQSRIRSRSAMYGLHSVDWSINDTFMLHASPINRRGLRMPGRLPRGSRVSKAWAARSWPPASRRARGVALRVGLVCSGRCGGS